MKAAHALLCTLLLAGCIHHPPPKDPEPPTPTPNAPTVSGITGTVAEGSTITINGSAFGSGPTLAIYDSFDGGTAGAEIPLDRATVGAWTETVSNDPIYSATARSGTSSFRTNYNGKTAQFKKDFATPASEVFVSFWVKIPDGTVFPGDNGGVKKFSSDSSWKLAWLIDTSYDGSSSDICIPTHIGSGAFSLAGNDMSLGQVPKGGTWWDWDHWMRISIWLRADPANPTTNGQYFWQAVSPQYKVTTQAESKPVFDADGDGCEKVWRYINVPGWIRSEGNSQPAYDDVYIATGANAQARVEISDAATYAESKHLALLIPKTWTASSISAQLPPASLPKDGPAYLYITDSQGRVNAAGIALNPDDGGGDGCECPPAR